MAAIETTESTTTELTDLYCAVESDDQIGLQAYTGESAQTPQPDYVMEMGGQAYPVLTAHSYFGSDETPPPNFLLGLLTMEDKADLDVLVFQQGGNVWLTHQEHIYRPCAESNGDAQIETASVEPNWSLSKVKHEFEQDEAFLCTLEETNGRAFRIEASFFTLDAKPPVNYPTVKLGKAFGDFGPMPIGEDGEPITWDFGNDVRVETLTMHDYENQQNVFYVPFEKTQDILVNLAKAERVTLTSDTLASMTYDIAGFSQAYRDMASACEFETVGVIED